MRRHPVSLVLVLAVAAVVVVLARSSSSPSRATAPAGSTRAAGGPLLPRGGGDALVPRSHYRLVYEQYVTLPGQPGMTVLAEGAWTTTPRADGRIEVAFTATAMDGPPGLMPEPADVQAPAQLVTDGGVLVAMGFADEAPASARRLLTSLATTFQYTPGTGAAWSVAEEDASGRYAAEYRRDGEATLRTRPRYTALRQADGLSAPTFERVTPAERTRFHVDRHGVVAAAVELSIDFVLGPGVPPARVELVARLDRTAVEYVRAPDGPAFTATPISAWADFDSADRNADRGLVGGATLDALLAEVKRLAAMPGGGPGYDRAQALAKLAATIRLDPAAAAAIAAQVRRDPEDVSAVRLLTGALSSSRIAAGTDALASLMADALPDGSRAAVVGALSFAKPPTAASLQALAAGLDQGHGRQAAMGLGTQARTARSTDPAGADRATDVLLERYAAAADPIDRRVYVEALGNGGDARALPVLRAAMTSREGRLAAAATFSLRFVPGDDADALLERALDDPALAFDAIRAAAYRDPARWRAHLHAAQLRYPDHNGLQSEIKAILRRWNA